MECKSRHQTQVIDVIDIKQHTSKLFLQFEEPFCNLIRFSGFSGHAYHSSSGTVIIKLGGKVKDLKPLLSV